MRRSLTVPRLVAVLALVAAAAVVPASSAFGAKAPAGLKFYTPPKTLAGKHGDLIRVRKLPRSKALGGAAKSYLLLYRSTAIDGKPIAVSGTLAIPKGRAPKGGWPVVSWAHGTTGAADICAPSRFSNPVDPNLNDWLKAGYAIASTDYEGLGTPGPHPYLIGASEGRGVIDIVTAAAQVDPQRRPALGRRRPLPGRPRRAVGGCAGKKWAPKLELLGVDAYAPGSHVHEEVGGGTGPDDASPLRSSARSSSGGRDGLAVDHQARRHADARRARPAPGHREAL